MKNVLNRAKFVCGGEEGASNLELVVWFSVVLAIAIVLIAFGGNVKDFMTGANSDVDKMSKNSGKIK
ncbi:hypothetical protein [Rossellomorea marisflavi]|uniref:hypothetical protein n=1 Tax=Rossellomorea marisflavi TaxID=189381 RepID=UPI003FA15E29